MNPDALDSIKALVDGFADLAEGVAFVVKSLGGGKDLVGIFGASLLTLFTTQIAKGISTTVVNMQNGKA